MNKQIENFIVNNYDELRKISKKITNNNSLSDDLLQDVILQLYQKKEIVLKNFTDLSIKYFIVSVMRINWHSKTSPFYYRIRREICLYSEINNKFDIPDDDSQYEFEREILFDCIETSWAELDFFRKSLLEMYMTMGSLNKVSKKTKIPISSIRRYIKEGKEEIIAQIKDKTNN